MTKKVLIAASGSVAAVKTPEIAVELLKVAEVRVVVTKPAEHFISISKDYNPAVWKLWKEAIEAKRIIVYHDEDEWKDYKNVRTDSVVHIELRKWADAFVVTPCSANTLGKFSNGLCDNLVVCVYMLRNILLFF